MPVWNMACEITDEERLELIGEMKTYSLEVFGVSKGNMTGKEVKS